MITKILAHLVFYISTFPFTTEYFIGKIVVFDILLASKLWKWITDYYKWWQILLPIIFLKVLKAIVEELLLLICYPHAPIVIAISLNDLQYVKHFIELMPHNTNNIMQNTPHWGSIVTPLHIAAWHGKEDISKFLLENGANVNASNRFGDTPLHFAVEDKMLN